MPVLTKWMIRDITVIFPSKASETKSLLTSLYKREEFPSLAKRG
jgi:hypothetical protein